jgi:predicted DNA-binding transcriptional regulator AlpA
METADNNADKLPKPVLTTAEVCAEYGISSTTLWRLRAAGLLRGKRFGRMVKYLRSDIENYIRGGPAHVPVTPALRTHPRLTAPRTFL